MVLNEYFSLSQQSELLFSSNVNLLCIYYNKKKNVNNQKLFFLHIFVGLGTTAIIQLKIEKRMMRVFLLVRVKPTRFWEM